MIRPLALILLFLLFLTYQVIFLNKFFPGVYLGDTNLTFQTKSQAQRLIEAKFNQRASQTLKFNFSNQEFNIDLSKTSPKLNLNIDETFKIGHEGYGVKRLAQQISAFFSPKITSPKIEFSPEPQIEEISQAVYKEAHDAKLSVNGDITEEVIGRELDKEALVNALKDYLVFGKTRSDLPVKDITPEVTTSKALTVKAYLEEVKVDPITLTYEGSNWVLDSKTILPILDLSLKENIINKEKLSNYLKEVSEKINQPLKEAQFNFNPTTGRVAAFQPAQQGRELDIDKTATLITLALEGERARIISLPVNIIEPKISTDSVNDLGIKELIGQGISHFAGSIPNRIYNVGLTATKINGVLIPPREIFSFNKTVGDITEATGFKKAYVIKEGRTVLDDGGGVCQDSTTLFRAVLNAGLPVVKRTAHAYRVGYYEQGFPPGLDATVFYPSVDFQFKNDTGHHILVQASVSGTTLTVDLYGTSDGRVAILTKPIISSTTPSPPELRQDDPTLPKGVVKQVDWAANGAQVSFQRTVKRGEEVLINETFRSNYRPWQAVYLVGTQ